MGVGTNGVQCYNGLKIFGLDDMSVLLNVAWPAFIAIRLPVQFDMLENQA